MVERSFCCFIRYWYYIMVDFNLLLSLQPMMFSTIESPGINAFCFFLKVKLALLSFLFSDGDVMLVLLLLFLSWDDDVTLVLLLFYLFCDNDVMLVLRLLFNMLWWRNVDVNIFVFILWWRCSVDWDIFFSADGIWFMLLQNWVSWYVDKFLFFLVLFDEYIFLYFYILSLKKLISFLGDAV